MKAAIVFPAIPGSSSRRVDFSQLEEAELKSNILENLQSGPLGIEELSKKTGFSIKSVATALSEMEKEGVIKKLKIRFAITETGLGVLKGYIKPTPEEKIDTLETVARHNRDLSTAELLSVVHPEAGYLEQMRFKSALNDLRTSGLIVREDGKWRIGGRVMDGILSAIEANNKEKELEKPVHARKHKPKTAAPSEKRIKPEPLPETTKQTNGELIHGDVTPVGESDPFTETLPDLRGSSLDLAQQTASPPPAADGESAGPSLSVAELLDPAVKGPGLVDPFLHPEKRTLRQEPIIPDGKITLTPARQPSQEKEIKSAPNLGWVISDAIHRSNLPNKKELAVRHLKYAVLNLKEQRVDITEDTLTNKGKPDEEIVKLLNKFLVLKSERIKEILEFCSRSASLFKELTPLPVSES